MLYLNHAELDESFSPLAGIRLETFRKNYLIFGAMSCFSPLAGIRLETP